MSGSGLYLPPSACSHPVEAVFGTFEPAGRLDVVCRRCWSAFDVDTMPMDLLERVVDHIRAGHFRPLRPGERAMWADLARDAVGILLFVVWLALPPIYVVVLGRSYLARCRLLYDQLRDYGCECDCCCQPEQYPEQHTVDLPVGRHTLRR